MKRIDKDDLNHILEHTASIWEPVANKTIFLTGGTGFFGKWLIESFIYINSQLRLNARLIVLSRDPEAFLLKYHCYKEQKDLIFLKGDIIDFEFPECKIDFIIHAATDASADLNKYQPLVMLDTITKGTRRILDLAEKQKVTSFLFISSGAVYGKQQEYTTHIQETDSFFIDINNPLSAYAEGKRLAELFCSIYFEQHRVPVKIARCFAFVGPYLPLDRHFAIGNFILNAVNDEDIIIKSDGTPLRSYMYAADLIIWLWTILLKGKANRPYNVGSDKSYSLRDVAKHIQSIKPNIEVVVKGEVDKGKHIEQYVPDISLSKEELGLKVYTNLLDSIYKTLLFYSDGNVLMNQPA